MPAESEMVTITATDGFETEAYEAIPDGRPHAGLICIMEAFGVNDHIRRVAKGYADEGYAVLAPALYDRIGRGLVFDYDAERAAAVQAMRDNGFDKPLWDISGCVARFRSLGIDKIGIVGYCYGGAVSWLAASRNNDIAAACCYYGSAIMGFTEDHPRCPTIAHWGMSDPTTPPEQVEVIARANPDVVMYRYEAGHGFNSDDRAQSYDAAAAQLARTRTLAFFRQYLDS